MNSNESIGDNKRESIVDETFLYDPRVVHICNIVSLFRQVSGGDVSKSFSDPKRYFVLKQFVDTDEINTIYLTIDESFDVSEKPPPVTNGEIIFLSKLNAGPVDLQSNAVNFGIFTKNIISDTFQIVDKVVIEYADQKISMQHFPDVAHWDCVQELHEMRLNLGIANTNIFGKINLPTPTDIIKRIYQCDINSLCGKNLRCEIEFCIHEWISQVDSIIGRTIKDARNEMIENGFYTLADEIIFWRKRMEQVYSICERIDCEETASMARFLELSESTEIFSFQNLVHDVFNAMRESEEAVRITFAIEPAYNNLDRIFEWNDFNSGLQLLFAVIYLIWNSSIYYTAKDNFKILLMNVIDTVMKKIMTMLESNNIFKDLSPESNSDSNIDSAILACTSFDNLYTWYQQKNLEESKTNEKIIRWNFSYNEVFARWIQFKNKLKNIKTVFTTTREYDCLNKLLLLVTSDNPLNSDIQSLFDEFDKSIKLLGQSGDPLDPSNESFLQQFSKFEQFIRHKDLYLSWMLQQAYNPRQNFDDRIEFINRFWSTIKRSNVHLRFKSNFNKLVKQLQGEIAQVTNLFKDELVLSNIESKNETCFIRECSMILSSYDFLRRMNFAINSMNSIKIINDVDNKKFKKDMLLLANEISTREKYLLNDFSQRITTLSSQIFKMTILKDSFDNNRHFIVNLPIDYHDCMKEIHYLLANTTTIDDNSNVTELLAYSSDIHKLSCTLTEIISLHEQIRENTSVAEYCLIEERWLHFYLYLTKLYKNVHWRETDIALESATIEYDKLKNIEQRLQKCRERISQALNSSDVLAESVFQQVISKNIYLLSGDMRKLYLLHCSNLNKWGSDVEKTLEQIRNDNTDYINWDSYKSLIDMEMLCKLYQNVELNIMSLADIMKRKPGDGSVVIVNIRLEVNSVICSPSLDMDHPTGLYHLMNNQCDDILYTSGMFRRIAEADVPGSYQNVIEECKEVILSAKSRILEITQSAINEANQFITLLENYSHLWKNNRADFMKHFTLFSRNLNETELKLVSNDPERFIKSSTIEDVKAKIDFYNKIIVEIDNIPSIFIIQNWLELQTNDFKEAIKQQAILWRDMFLDYLSSFVIESLQQISELVDSSLIIFNMNVSKGEQSALIKISQHLKDFTKREKNIEMLFEPITIVMNVLKEYNREVDENTRDKLIQIYEQWFTLHIKAVHMKQKISPFLTDQIAAFRAKLVDLEQWQEKFRSNFITYGPFNQNIPEHYERIDGLHETILSKLNEVNELRQAASVFDMVIPEFKQLNLCKEELEAIKQLWDVINIITSSIAQWRTTTWKDANIEMIEQTLKQKFLLKELRALSKVCSKWENFKRIENEVKNMLSAIRVISELKTDSMRDRHWNELMNSTTGFYFRIDDEMKLDDLLKLNLHAYEDQVRNIVEKSIKELSMEKVLSEISTLWTDATFEVVTHERTGTPLLVAHDYIIESLDDHQNQLQMMATSKYADYFANDLTYWQTQLAAVDQVLRKLIDVQKTWSYLETIFMGTQDIRTKLPKETRQFHILDSDFKNICKSNIEDLNIVRCMNRPMLLELFESVERRLAQSQKALEGYLETKRIIFPRFYFISPTELLDILSNGTNPSNIMHLLIKLFDSIDKLEIESLKTEKEVSKEDKTQSKPKSTKSSDVKPSRRPRRRNTSQQKHKSNNFHFNSNQTPQEDDISEETSEDNEEDDDDMAFAMDDLKYEEKLQVLASGMYSDDGEYVKFVEKCVLEGQVENWINVVLQTMKNTIRHWLKEAIYQYEHQQRTAWIFQYPAQIILTGSQIWWTTEVNSVFQAIETNSNALKDYIKKQVNQLNDLIKLLLGNLSESDRQKITTLCLINLHERDIVEKMIVNKIENSNDFMWQSQLRFRWSDVQSHCFADICDANFLYQYEYLGNKSRLVITPLTDRCYITLTQSLHLHMGGAPAGPAGTGKTETTKDLGRSLGVRVVVSNCSEQMDYSSLGNLFKGLAQSGLWGCFDEFNRITADVLSVVSIQVKTILYALRAKKERFDFMNTEISLNSSVGIFITMNPGYAGRTELPENMKALFRPCAMIVPDFDLITELNLVSAGFTDAKLLARKFVTLYSLCRDLLSKQDHYDWGLRAIKSVLVVAGNLRRADPELPEDMVLMRALRDFNIPKITNDDLPIFLGLIKDLFPSLEVPRKLDVDLEKYVKQAALELKLQCNDEYNKFGLKVIQLKELLDVRHSVFIVGDAGCGKSCVWKTLQHAYRLMSQRPIAIDLNPKAVTNDELFGVVNKMTREWKDGLLSMTMRQLSNLRHSGPKWIVLDGDIDPMWIESLNTVMDDNKVLTLASNERIPLTKTMRLIFEIFHLRTATPATVSRAGILYINPNDVNYHPLFYSWLDKRQSSAEKVILQSFFEKYVNVTFECLREKCRKAIPIVEVSHINNLCVLLSCILTNDRVPAGSSKEWYQINFEFAWIWAVGGVLVHDQYGDHRNTFSKWWVAEFKQPTCSHEGSTIFDYYADAVSQQFELWKQILPEFDYDATLPNQMVPTVENERIRYWLSQLIDKAHPVMLVGAAGTGKTMLINDCLNNLNGENYSIANISLNYATNCETMQCLLERKLERKAGKTFAPPGKKKIVFYIDDLNMPHIDNYLTVQAHTILRQYLDYGHWYDRQKLLLKEIRNVQLVTSMNQNAGNFFVSPRLQRHFITFAMSFPTKESLQLILTSILNGHFINRREAEFQFTQDVHSYIPQFVEGIIAIHAKIANMFLPTALKFHYLFNMRDIQRIVGGLLFSNNECVQNSDSLIRLYSHEAYRTYSDKMMSEEDVLAMDKLLKDVIYKEMKPKDLNYIYSQPLIYSHYAADLGMPTYLPVKTVQTLQQFTQQSLKNYNDVNSPTMDLVLFEDALTHICRISRILETSNGNALLIGVGGSGKQSVARLAAFISSIDIFKVDLRSFSTISDFLQVLNNIYRRTGTKSLTAMLLVNGAEDADDTYMAVLNDILSTGDVFGMFTEDETTEIISALKTEMKAIGMEVFDRNSAWSYFMSKVKSNLKIVITFSPVGNSLRRKARHFPAIINNTMIDWFHRWPKEAMMSVADNSLRLASHINQSFVPRIAKFMSDAHDFVDRTAKSFLYSSNRFYYTTPKTFLEFISLYIHLTESRTLKIKEDILRIKSGLSKLESVSEQTAVLKQELAEKEVIVNARTETADALLKVVSAEADKVSKQKAEAELKNARLEEIKNDVQRHQASCAEDLEKVKPVLIQAAAALETLTKDNLSELKSFNSPPDMVKKVMECVIILMAAKTGKVPDDRSWKAAKLTIGQVTEFLRNLQNYDKDNIPIPTANLVKRLLKAYDLDPDKIKHKSFAAAGLCAWIVNIMKYHDVFQDILPKKLALDEADAKLTDAKKAYDVMMSKVKELENQLEEKNQEMRGRLAEKDEAVKNKSKTAKSIELANRLVLGLASSRVIWEKRTKELQQDLETLIGDMLITSAFLTYMGYFSMQYRDAILEKWITLLKSEEPFIPYRSERPPIKQLIDDADIAEWVNQGLPNDEMSFQNAAILLNVERCALIVDPQLQGTRWLRRRFDKDIVITKLDQKAITEIIPESISRGQILLIQNVPEQIDSVLECLIDQSQIRKTRKIKWNKQDLNVHPNFKIILQSKLVNPHYKPETQAMITLINFSVTVPGLESQLLASVVASEMPSLEKSKYETTIIINQNKITLKRLESQLLTMLANAEGNFIQNIELVETLESNVNTAKEIELKTREATLFNEEIDRSREVYRPTAVRGRMLFFILDNMYKIHPMYKFNLKAFKQVFDIGVEKAVADDNLQQRVLNIVNSVTLSMFEYTAPGLFEEHKLIFISQIAIQAAMLDNEIKDEQELDFLLKFAIENQQSTLVFLSDKAFSAIKTLSKLRFFSGLDLDIEANSRKWKTFVDSEAPETLRLHGEWINLNDIQKLCIIRALRPDRMVYAMRYYQKIINLIVRLFIEQKLGKSFTMSTSRDIASIVNDSSMSTPIFFILSPGVDPVNDLEQYARSIGFSIENDNFFNISLGQGQEIAAETILQSAAKKGHWVVLQNIHLVPNWLPQLERYIELFSEKGSKHYRLFLTAEPAPDISTHVIPQGILEVSIKITNEPPTGMNANLHKALDSLTQDLLDSSNKEVEFKTILFALCYFHATATQRIRFGPIGWNKSYPFGTGDLSICSTIVLNYLEINQKVPYAELRYLIGEIMYGGHITDDWDRRLCKCYLDTFINPQLIDGNAMLAPGFAVPSATLDLAGFHDYVTSNLPTESPRLYGLHSNAEVEFLETTIERVFIKVLDLQPKETTIALNILDSLPMDKDEEIKIMVDDILNSLPDEFVMSDIMLKIENANPYMVVAVQECERMNILIAEMRRSLDELSAGLRGELSISSQMEDLQQSLSLNIVPTLWSKKAYPSQHSFGLWIVDLLERQKELDMWISRFTVPDSVWLGGLFNPQSFLTAIMQTTARKNEWSLDRMSLSMEVTSKKNKMDGIQFVPKDAIQIHGVYLDGASWDRVQGRLSNAIPMNLCHLMPPILLRAVQLVEKSADNNYECPMYKTKQRGPTYIWKFSLKSKEHFNKWTMAGVAMLLQN